MDLMEAIRLMQFSVDKLRVEVQEVKIRQDVLFRKLSGIHNVTRSCEASCDSLHIQSKNGTSPNGSMGKFGHATIERKDSGGHSKSTDQPHIGDQSEGKRKNLAIHQTAEPEIMIYGDSRVRFLDRAFCERNRNKRTRVCLPGARLKDLVDRFDDTIRGSSPNSVVVLHCGVNDVGNTLSEELIDNYRMVITSIVNSGRKGIITGILPKLGAGTEWSSRAIGINERVKRLCKKSNVRFVDYWENFWDKRELYSIDGYHLSREGVLLLSDLYEREFKSEN